MEQSPGAKVPRSDLKVTNAALFGALAARVVECGFIDLNLSADWFDSQSRDAAADVQEVFSSWDHLARDAFMADGGDYRYRRHGRFQLDVCTDRVTRLAHAPHYQEVTFNHLNGGIERQFEPIEARIGENPVFKAVLQTGACVATALSGETVWNVEAHQFRILARSDGGKPTPEGSHRDGVDYVLIVLLQRRNVTGGATFVSDSTGREVYRHVLADCGDAVFLDDRRVEHGVDPIFANNQVDPAFRDALVVTYRKVPDAKNTGT